MVFPKRDDEDKREDGHTLPTTTKIEKKKLPRRPPLPSVFLFLIPQFITILNPRLVVYHFSFLSNRIRKAEEINRTSRKKGKDLRLFIADSSEKASCTRLVGILYIKTVPDAARIVKRLCFPKRRCYDFCIALPVELRRRVGIADFFEYISSSGVGEKKKKGKGIFFLTVGF